MFSTSTSSAPTGATSCANSSRRARSGLKSTIPSPCTYSPVLFILDTAKATCLKPNAPRKRCSPCLCSQNSPKPSSAAWLKVSRTSIASFGLIEVTFSPGRASIGLDSGDEVMRNFPTAALGISLALLVVGPVSSPKAQTSAADAVRKPVVVELFTSEGCSTCPPADVLLQKLEEMQPVAGAEIIPLEEHVDYWNHDGWIDPYSSQEWTARQLTYQTLFKKDIYTPQFVVDGNTELVVSSPHAAVVELEKATQRAKAAVSITAGQSEEHGSQHFTVSVGKLEGNTGGDPAEVWLAVTEDGLHNSVSRGENAGRVLNHVATLRSLHKIGVADAAGASASFTGDALVKLKSDWDLAKVHVTVFVQKKKSREILGAASIRIKS